MITKFFALLVMLLTLSACAGAASEPKTSSPQGEWAYSEGAMAFEATVVDDSIVVHIVSDDTKSLFWKGDFETGDVVEGDILPSSADTEALDASLMGSSENVKPFVYTGGTLEFEFSMMGSTRDVEMKRQ